VSSEMGLRKPDRAAFEAVAAATGFRLDEILFFDDTEENVIGARLAGMPATLVNSHADVEIALTDIGAL
jgi:HAD superfamily hydrolase (TIGR01509 family)